MNWKERGQGNGWASQVCDDRSGQSNWREGMLRGERRWAKTVAEFSQFAKH